MLIDEVKVTIKAGNGGDGAVSFRRNAQTPKGGPDGGNGGNGGSVYFQGTQDTSALRQFQFKKKIEGEAGIPGKKSNLYGKNGQPLIIKVPIGTQVIDLSNKTSFEILNDNEQILIASGGLGGRGNNSFKTATNQTPKNAEKGTPGEEKNLSLILHIIADIGLIGLPNAGKSSILKSLTNADPKIGNYPFTTLEPNLGVLDNLVIADIPGLIEGASLGKGLGVGFLKHIEKTKMIVHCISLENDNLLKAYLEVETELKKFNPSLLSKTKLIVLTKSDLFDKVTIEKKKKTLGKKGIDVINISIFDPGNIQYLKEKILNFL